MQTYTHEAYIHAVREIAAARIPESERAPLFEIKLVYGSGRLGTRGTTYFGCWKNGHPTDAHPFVEVCAFGEESPVQVAGTTIHELAHVLAGPSAGHGADWHAACARLGLCKVQAAGTNYVPECFDADVWQAIQALPVPADGRPTGSSNLSGAPVGLPLQLKLRPCGAGIGTRGGKSHGIGSGSRLRKFACDCGVIARVARDDFRAVCTLCNSAFHPSAAQSRKAAS